MEEKNKKYTAADFKKYHCGEMTGSEMHELEKAALEDPFLSDALEGYAFSSNIETDISQIKSRLEEKQKNRKVFSINTIAQNKWWRIAALFIIIAGAGYFFYNLNNAKEDALAKNEIRVPEGNKTELDSALKDSTVAGNGIVAFEKQETRKDNTDLQNFSVEKDKKISEPKPGSEPMVASAAESNPKKDSYKNDEFKKPGKQNQAVPEYEFKGRITDEEGKPISMATITDKENRKATITDTTGAFVIRSDDSNKTVIASAAGYDQKDITLKQDQQPTIKMKKANANDEVALLPEEETRRQKEKVSYSKELSGKAAGVDISTNRAKPRLRNDQFDKYLEQNKVPIYDENNKQLTGEVSLSFRINKKGRPVDIKIIESSCKACEEQATRLLENGPDWKPAEIKYGTVTIKF